jgi:hypothetical protein
MKRIFLLPVLMMLVVYFAGCDPKEDPTPDPDPPVIDLITETISTAPGHLFWIKANLNDDVGLKRVNLLKQDWYLDKDIDLSDSTRTEYELKYKFLTPADAVPEGHILKISVEDAGGNITSVDVPVLFDKDVEAPEFNITSPSEGLNVYGGDNIRLFIEVTDNNGIDTFQVSAPELGIDTLIVFDPVNPRYIYVKDYMVPDPITDGTYYITVVATDGTGNKTEQMISIIAGDVAVGEVYCVGGATWSGWDAPDNPMLMRHDPENEGWYEILTYSYGEQDQNGVKFIGQRAWGPLNWGLDPDNTEQMINDEGSLKIILEEEGYHKVRFNPEEMAYSTEFVGADTPLRNEMYILGSGIVGMENAYLDPSGALPMTQDTDNPYLFTATVEFTDIGVDDWGASFIFIGNKGDVSEFNLGFWYYPKDVKDPDWLDWYGYVIGDLSLNLDPLTEEQVGNISDFPPSDGYWNGVPYVAYYLQAGTYDIKLDYHIRHASITKVTE